MKMCGTIKLEVERDGKQLEEVKKLASTSKETAKA